MMYKFKLYWLALGSAFLTRVIWAALVPVLPLSDGAVYDTLAENLVKGIGFGWSPGYLTAYWAPGTSLVYAALYRVAGHSFLPIVILNVLLGIWVVVAAMWLAEKWFDARVGVTTGLVLAFWLNLVAFTTLLASELLFIALVLAALMVRQVDGAMKWRRVLLLGILFAAATYVRAIGLGLPLLFMILELSKRHHWRTRMYRILAAAAVMVLLLAPWSFRNTQLFGQFVFFSTDGGAVLWQGITYNPFSEPERPLPAAPGLNEAQRDQYWRKLAIDVIRAAPASFILSFFQHLLYMSSRETAAVVWNQDGLTARFGAGVLLPLKGLSTLYWFLALGFGFVGAVVLFKRRGGRGALFHPALVMAICLTLPPAIFSPQDRFHIPSVPFLAMLTAYGLVVINMWVTNRRDRSVDDSDRALAPDSAHAFAAVRAEP